MIFSRGHKKEWPFLTDGLLRGSVGRELEVTPETTYQSALGQLEPGEHLYVLMGGHLAWGLEDEEDFRLNCRKRSSELNESLRLFALDSEADNHYSQP